MELRPKFKKYPLRQTKQAARGFYGLNYISIFVDVILTDIDMRSKRIRHSILELAAISEGKTIQQTLKDSLDLARRAEALGYERFWLAEHHNAQNIASVATSVLIGYIAKGIELFPNNQVKVFNRWGNVVYEARHYNNQDIAFRGEDSGRLGGGDAPETTYYFLITVEGLKPITGYVIMK